MEHIATYWKGFEGREVKTVPNIVTLCGSTKFKKEFEAANLEETLAGNIVVSVACFTHHDNLHMTEDQKRFLDELHLKKINISNEILVINVNGYIGESTRNEINYAKATGKGIRYLETIVKYSRN
jgi:hypothetical protein